MKPFYLFFFCLFTQLFHAQSNQTNSLSEFQNKDNLEGFIYWKIDAFSKKTSLENLVIFNDTPKQFWRTPNSNSEKIAWLHFQIQHAYQCKKLGQLSISVQKYEKAFHYYTAEQLHNYDILEYCLLPMANNYTKLGAFERSETILKVAESMASKKDNNQKLIAVYNNLSIVYQSQGYYKKAAKLLTKTAALKGLSTLQKARILGNIALVHVRLKQLDSALIYAQKSLKLNPKNLELAQKLASITALYYQNKNKFLEAEISYKKAISIADQLYGSKSREFIKSSINLAHFYIKQEQLEKGKTLFLDCLKIQQYLSVDNTLKTIHEGLGTIAFLKNDLNAAIQHYKNGLKANSNLKNTLTSDVSKIRLMAENNALSEKIIEAYYLLYQSTKKDKYAMAALNISENNKASIVTDQLRQYASKTTSKNTLFKEETALKLRKNQLLHRRMLEEKKQKTANIATLKDINNSLNIISNKIQKLSQKIQVTYPNIYKPTPELTQKNIFKLLKNKEQLLIEFFVGSESVYVFSISKNKSLSFRKIKNKAFLQEEIRLFYDLFANNGGTKIHSNIQKYKQLAHQLYLKLIAPEIQIASYTSLIIIPDAAIALLPFDALLTTPTTHSNFSKLPYLLHQTELIYNASIQIMRLHKTGRIEHTFTGFFPVFDTENNKHAILKNTLSEAENLLNTINGKVFLRADASKENFLKQQYNTNILHVATHASSGSFGEPPSLEFINNTLYLTELYGLQFKTQLIVLSACETNVGPIYKGEGMLSLARGFLYAGVQNSIVSQWKVNDKSTEQLMSEFYIQLKKTSDVAKALQQSKKAYLSDDNVHSFKKSPYYWAGFSYFGQVAYPAKKTSKYWLVLFLCFLFLIGYVYYRRSF